MPKSLKCSVFLFLILVLLCGTALSDLTVKTKVTMSGIPMLGNMDNEQIALITKNQNAIVINMNNPQKTQMGEPGIMQMRVILRNGGKEFVSINQTDSTYSVVDASKFDSIGAAIKAGMGALDSLIKNVKIEKNMVAMSGKTKKIQGLKADEMILDLAFQLTISVMGPEPTSVKISISGSQWVSKDFPEYSSYKQAYNRGISKLTGGSNQFSGMGGMIPILEKLGLDKKAIDVFDTISGYVSLEGIFNLSVDILPTDTSKQEDSAQMPAMSINMQMITTAVEVSTERIPASEFEIPKGFKKIENIMLPSGGFSLPGMGK